MAFADAFVQCMQNAGVNIDSGAVTEENHFSDAVNYIQQWINSLDSDTKEALDAATTDDQASYLLAEANVAPGVPDLLNAFDSATGWPLSTLVDWCVHCIAEASQQGESGQGEQQSA